MKAERQTELPEKIENVLFRIQRGLAGYMSYLAACDMNEAFSEYLLYEPILRILLSQGFKVDGEAIAPRVQQPKRGDKKRLDFLIEAPAPQFAIEVKWAWPEPVVLDIERDIEKLVGFCHGGHGMLAILCVFGTFNRMKGMKMSKVTAKSIQAHTLSEIMDPVFATFKKTQYGCKVFQLKLN